MSSSAHTLSELLQARVPSLSVMQSGGVAAQGAQIRSRGTRSFYQASAPIVIVDGMRVDATQDATVVPINVSSSRIDDIAPADIARIDVLPGPAAAGMYGAGAAGGAIVITTKRGGAPGLHLSSRAQSGIGMIVTHFPANYALMGVTSAGQTIQCPLYAVAAGQCTPTGLDTWNSLENASPFRTAQNASGALAVAGAVRQAAARVGLTVGRALGVTTDDDEGRFGSRLNLTQRVGASLELSGIGGYVQTSAGLPVRGNVFDRSNVIANGLLGSAEQDTLEGYLPVTALTSTRERVRHWTGGATADWNAFGLLRISGIYGRDAVAEADVRRGNNGIGNGPSVESARFDHGLTTITLSVRTADWTLVHPSLRTRTLIVYDQLRSGVTARDSIGFANYPNLYSLSWVTSEARIVGRSARQELSWHNRVSLGAGARWEHWAHGSTHFLKNADFSWLAGPALHLRAAYGEANNWTPSQPPVAGPAINPMLFGPEERVKEAEVGADFAFTDRLRFSLTTYRADASHLFALQPAPSGFGGGGLVSNNEGSVRNEGIELASRLRVVHTGWMEWDATVRASTLHERTVSVGPTGTNVFVPYPGSMNAPGSTVNGYVARPYTYADVNNDGLIGWSEVQSLNSFGASAGTSLPTREASLLSTWNLPHGVTVAALVDYHGGQKLANMNEAYRCVYVQDCRAMNDRSASLADQARALVSSITELSYVEDASFAKLREVSVRWRVPPAVAELTRVPASITIAGRNLATWTRYSGLDPELNTRPSYILPRADFAETPLPREVLVRFDVGDGR